MRFAVYSRKSKATSKGDSIENQIEMAKDYINSNFKKGSNEIVAFEDNGFSGKSIKRPSFMEMMEKVEKKEFDYVVVYRLDRISRSVRDFSEILDTLEKSDTKFISINEKFDTSTPMGRAMMYISSVFAQMERETISERVTDNMYEMSKSGVWLGGRAPFGFIAKRILADQQNGIAKDHSVLEEVPEEIEIIKYVFKVYGEIGAIHSTIKRLTSENIHFGEGTLFTDSALKGVLSNPVYATADKDTYNYFKDAGATIVGDIKDYDGSRGLIAYNRHKLSGRFQNRPIEEWVISISSHEGIIDSDTWISAQKRLKKMKLDHPRESGARNDYALLSGILTCKKCGAKMYTQPQNSGRGRRESGAFTYICESRKNYGPVVCDCKSVSGKVLDDAIMNELSKYDTDGSDIYKKLQKLVGIKAKKRDDSEEIFHVQKRIDAKQKEIKSYMSRIADDTVQGAIYQEIVKSCESAIEERDKLIDRKKELEKSRDTTEDEAVGIDYIKSAMKSLSDGRSEMTVGQQREIITSIIEKVEWDGESACVFVRGE